ncbi:MAG: hypothetical protein U0L54_02295 [Bacteroidales bacterium]|nr:hypothetical protein [Bacteroidales bacterium]
MGNEIATVRISEFFIVMLQCDNFDGTKVISNKRNADEKSMMIIFFSSASFLATVKAKQV